MQGPLSRPRWIACVELAGVMAFATLWAIACARLARGVSGVDLVAAVAIGSPLGWMAADLVSGIVHWLADNFFEEETPVLGPLLIYAFREHHRDPLAIVRRASLEVSGYNAVACVPVLLVLTALPAPAELESALLHACVLVGTLGVVATNQFHKWAHAERVPRWISWLQRAGLILSPRSHARHHRRRDIAYCVTTGWLNRPMDGLGVFQALTRWVRAARRATAFLSPAGHPGSRRCGSEPPGAVGRRSGSR